MSFFVEWRRKEIKARKDKKFLIKKKIGGGAKKLDDK